MPSGEGRKARYGCGVHSRRSPFGVRLAAAITAAGISQRAFAKQVGVDQGTLQAMLSGRRKPRLRDIESWADTLGLAGQVRAAFLEAGWLALSPPQVTAIIAALRAGGARR